MEAGLVKQQNVRALTKDTNLEVGDPIDTSLTIMKICTRIVATCLLVVDRNTTV